MTEETPKLHSKFSQPKALEVTKGDGPRKANVVHEPRKRPRPKGNENTVPGAAPKRTRYGNKGTASEADVPKRTQYDIKIKMDLQGGPVDHLKMIDTIFSQMLKPQILSNLVNNTFNPLGCTLVKFITIPAGSIQYSVQCADVIVLKDTFQSTEDSSLDKQLDRALLTKDVIGEEEGIKIKTTIDEAEFKQAEGKLVKLDLPGIPSTPNAVNIDKTSVKLTWSPPEGNQESDKFRVTAYIVEKCDISKGYWSQVNKKVCESSYAIKNLTPGNQYQFRVRAVNAAGVGKASAAVDIITAKEPPHYSLFDSPSQPGKPEGEIINRTSIRITWLAPKKDGGSPITGYVIEQSLGQSEQWTRVSKEKVTEPSYTIEDLKAGTQYQFEYMLLRTWEA
ncbi:immunoglobulin superfamily member 22-like [Amphiura filiformis]|uniref:immunoglobulin superfamily member 22-like n=1 Tax=Amphiura filiformis TaxID=82378 RepID=UPI003B212EFF